MIDRNYQSYSLFFIPVKIKSICIYHAQSLNMHSNI